MANFEIVLTIAKMTAPAFSSALDPEFAEDLAGFDLALLDEDSGPIVGLWPDLRIGYYNAGWARFAHENGGDDVLVRWPLGASIASAISADVRPFLDAALAAVRPGGPPLEQGYECSSATEWRYYLMRIHGLRRGFLITHSLLLPRAHEVEPAPATEKLYRDERGMIVQCSFCRRTRSNSPLPRWDWVPEFVSRSPPATSHGLCPTCYGYYYPVRRAG